MLTGRAAAVTGELSCVQAQMQQQIVSSADCFISSLALAQCMECEVSVYAGSRADHVAARSWN